MTEFTKYGPVENFCNFVLSDYTMKPGKARHIDFTAVIQKSDDGWYVGQLQEYPEVISQGRTIQELKVNLLDALELIVAHNRETIDRPL